MGRKISLITMGQGNVIALKKTFESFKGIVDEFIYGDLLIFDSDREVLNSYKEFYNLKIVKYPFNYIFNYGFYNILNSLAEASSNDLVMYMNTSEVIDEDYGITKLINENEKCNCFFFIHKTDHNRWFRIYDRRYLYWSGLIHESIVGDFRPYHKPIFCMKDLEKDMDDKFKADIFNMVKEFTYFNQLIKIVDNPNLLGETNIGWLHYAKTQYDSMKERMNKRKEAYEAFKEGDYDMFMHEIHKIKEFEYSSSELIEYQGDPKFLGK